MTKAKDEIAVVWWTRGVQARTWLAASVQSVDEHGVQSMQSAKKAMRCGIGQALLGSQGPPPGDEVSSSQHDWARA